MTQAIRYAARSDVGLLREGNEDSAYAGPRLLAVADGMGGHVGGEIASAAAIDAIRPLDTNVPAADLLAALELAVKQANENLHRIVENDPALQGMGTTLTAMLWSGAQLALVHIGDSRAYLLRNGELFQITHDHTLVQSLVDEGRITVDEAASHPQRSLLLRALDGRGEIEPDLTMREAVLGDRYLLCSDGLSGVVSAETIHRVLSTVPDPEQAVRELIDLANRGGGPDNITCVVADVVDPGQQQPGRPMLAGAAANPKKGIDPGNGLAQDTPAQRAAALPLRDGPPPQPGPAREDTLPEMRAVRPRRRWTWLALALAVFLLLIAGIGVAGWKITRDSYYLAENKDGQVVIYQGVDGSVLGFDLSKIKETPSPRLLLGDLPKDQQDLVRKKDQGLSGFEDAQEAVARMRGKVCKYSLRISGNKVVLQQGVDKKNAQLPGCEKREIKINPAVDLANLPTKDRQDVKNVLEFGSQDEASARINDLNGKAEVCKTVPNNPGCPQKQKPS